MDTGTQMELRDLEIGWARARRTLATEALRMLDLEGERKRRESLAETLYDRTRSGASREQTLTLMINVLEKAGC